MDVKKAAGRNKPAPKPAGLAITRFFGVKAPSNSGESSQPLPASGPAARPWKSWSKEAAAAAEDRLFENVMLSQDDEITKVVLKAPEASYEKLPKGTQSLLKQFLVRAAAENTVGTWNRMGDDLLEDLLSSGDTKEGRQQVSDTNAEEPSGASVQTTSGQYQLAERQSRHGQGVVRGQAGEGEKKEIQWAQESDGSCVQLLTSPVPPQKTPAPPQWTPPSSTGPSPFGGGSRKKNRNSLGLAPGSAMKRTGNRSGGDRRSSGEGRTPGSARTSTGQKRKAVLEILEQVETLLSQGPSPVGHGVSSSITRSAIGFTGGAFPRPPPCTPTSGRPRGSNLARRTPQAVSRQNSPGVQRHGIAALKLRKMQQAAESVGQLCDELLQDSPPKRLGPSDLFETADETRDSSGKENRKIKDTIASGERDAAPPCACPRSVPSAQALEPSASLGDGGRGGSRAPILAPLPLLGGREALHHTVLEVLEDDGTRKILRLVNDYQDHEVELVLSDSWADTPVVEGDTLNLMAEVETIGGRKYARVDMDKGLVVVHPDLLISGTRVANAFKCLRQASIEELFGGDSGGNEKAVLGTLLHELFQVALQGVGREQHGGLKESGGGESGGGGQRGGGGRPGTEELMQAAEDIVRGSTLMLFEVGLDEPRAKEALVDAIPVILRWREVFCQPKPGKESRINMGPKGPGNDGFEEQKVAVSEVIDIEESIWSPRFGLKGMIDVSVRAELWDVDAEAPPSIFCGSAPAAPQSPSLARLPRVFSGRAAPRRSLGGRKQVVAPLELKTGKAFHGHRAQVALYMLLMSDRYTADVSTGLLCYIHEEKPQGVQYIHGEVASLLQLRNNLASHLMRTPEPHGPVPHLPPVLQDPQACKSCFQREACMQLHRSIEDGTAESSGVGAVFEDHAGHILPSHAEFVKRWLALVEAEAKPSSQRSDIWALTSEERASSGGACVGRLRFLGAEEQLMGEVECRDSSPVRYVYERHKGDVQAEVGEAELPLAIGDRILLSVEGKHVAVARGTIVSIVNHRLTLQLHRTLSRWLVDNAGEGHVWRVDSDSLLSTAATLRRNVLSLLGRGRGRLSRLRELLMDHAAPGSTGEVPGEAEKYLAQHSGEMNADQAHAVRKVLRARDYAVILGMPGTGKTSTICHIVGALTAAGLSVLLTAYTNSAVDNMLLRLKAQGRGDFLRIGSRGYVHPSLQDHCLGSHRFPAASVAELRDISASLPVVGATCLGVGHTLLQHRFFDVVVIDEASQITLPASLGALSKAGKFVLVGDHYQLPPLVVNSEAAARGLGTSLFESLTSAHPSACAVLSRQYRMCGPIMALANRLVYSDSMRCGSSQVESARLRLTGAASGECGQQTHRIGDGWLSKVVSEGDPLVFLDTDGAAPDSRSGSSSCNPGESAVVLSCLEALIASGMDPSDAAIISPYRSQVSALSRAVGKLGASAGGAEVLTIDKSQGRDKSCVLMSLVKSNKEHNPGDLLTDWRRINVAVTRAKHKLVMVGCRKTLQGVPFFSELIKAAQEGGYLVTLPGSSCRP